MYLDRLTSPTAPRNDAVNVVPMHAVLHSEFDRAGAVRVRHSDLAGMNRGELRGILRRDSRSIAGQREIVIAFEPEALASNDASSVLERHPEFSGKDANRNPNLVRIEHRPDVALVELVTPRVPRLLLAGGPSAIAGFVVPVVVAPIERLSGRPRADVLDERVDAVLPALTHLNSAPAVVVIGGAIRVQATISDAEPSGDEAKKLDVCHVFHSVQCTRVADVFTTQPCNMTATCCCVADLASRSAQRNINGPLGPCCVAQAATSDLQIISR